MNFRELYTTKFMLIALTSAVAIDAVLTTMVICQQHEQNTVTDQASIRADAPRSGARIPAGSDIAAAPNAIPQVDPATTPHPVDVPIGSFFPAPGSPTPQAPTTPVQVASAPRIITPSQQTLAAQKSFRPKIVTRRRRAAACITAVGRNTADTGPTPDSSHYSDQILEARCTARLLSAPATPLPRWPSIDAR
jgi:hypothetical protein